jgi:hypothetical protein
VLSLGHILSVGGCQASYRTEVERVGENEAYFKRIKLCLG